MHRDLLGMLAIWVFSVPALILSVLLTILKFRSDHQCDAGLLSTCHKGWFTCTTIFQDSWSTIAGLPLTIYAAAFYVVVATLAGLTLFMPRRMRLVARTALLAFAWGGLFVTLILASYAVFYLRSMCLYCGYFYGVNVAVFVAARMMHPDGTVAGLRPLVRAPEATAVFAVSALGFVTALLLQRALYLRAIAGTDPYALQPCVTRLNGLEPSDIMVPSQGAARVVVKLFIDLDCPFCREELTMWRQLVEDANRAGRPIELRIFQFPRDACNTTPHRLDASPNCNAARALLCLTREQDAAEAVARLVQMFELQEASGQHFSPENLARVARKYGFDADPTRPADTDPFFGCMQSEETTATLHRHVRLAREVGRLTASPSALIIKMVDGHPNREAWRVLGRKPREQLEAWIAQRIADTERS